MIPPESIKALQRRLGVPADGVFGPLTFGAVIGRLNELDGFKAAGRATGGEGPQTADDATAASGGAVAGAAVALRTSPEGIGLIHSFEQCRLTAYPDPGSADGNPWTVGWGSTGPDIRRGTVWTQEQADERFARDLARFEDGVRVAVAGAPTSQHQFDALVSLAYNIGIKGMAGSTVVRRHKAGDHKGAADAFGMWVKNNNKVMRGLVRRRAAEAEMYRGGS